MTFRLINDIYPSSSCFTFAGVEMCMRQNATNWIEYWKNEARFEGEHALIFYPEVTGVVLY